MRRRAAWILLGVGWAAVLGLAAFKAFRPAPPPAKSEGALPTTLCYPATFPPGLSLVPNHDARGMLLLFDGPPDPLCVEVVPAEPEYLDCWQGVVVAREALPGETDEGLEYLAVVNRSAYSGDPAIIERVRELAAHPQLVPIYPAH